MVTAELLSYIKGELGKGISIEQIKSSLIASGWEDSDINTAISQINGGSPQPDTSLASQSFSDTSQAEKGIQSEQTSPSQITTDAEKDNRTLITALLLIFVYPVGVIVMWFWSRWKIWLKILVSLPILIGPLIFLLLGAFILTHPGKLTTTKQTGAEIGANGNSCIVNSDCKPNKCIFTGKSNVCSNGDVGSACFIGSDCQSKHCVDKICTLGNVGDKCFVSFDCQNGFSCTSGLCQSNITTPTPTSSNSVNNEGLSDPIKIFSTAFNSSNFQVSSTGKVSNTTNGSSSTQTSSIDMSNNVFYYSKSILVRVDMNGFSSPRDIFLQDKNVVILYPQDHTYSIIKSDDPLYKLTTDVFSYDIISSLVSDDQKSPLTWSSSAQNQWQTDWNHKFPFITDWPLPLKIKITLDDSHLIKSFSFDVSHNSQWQDLTYKYQSVADSTSWIQIPSNFTLKK